ncbi:MAG: gluconate 2-dehydrogenase subunit 3 family protein [Nitrospira sp.]|nr:gluconate 2-dehydrogenase subunit 3 family protein [Nitrospira sp.]
MSSTQKQDDEFRSPYPHYNVLDKWLSPDWDDQTRTVVRNRLEKVPPIRFFSETEAQTLAAVAERIVPQPDRTESGKIPIVPWIDEKLYEDKRDGYRYEKLPPQRQAWQRGLAGINETAGMLFKGRRFADLDAESQDTVLKRIQSGDSPGEIWKQLPGKPFFEHVLLKNIVRTYYMHPIAWNEIGYNGPSSPRGHARIWGDGLDPWEAQEETRRR